MAGHFLYHNDLRLYLANVDNYFVFHDNFGSVTQVVHFFANLIISVLQLNSLFISFISTKYTNIFLMDKLTNVSLCLESVLIDFLFVFWLMRLMIVEGT